MLNQLDAHEKTRAADFTDQSAALLQVAQSVEQISADFERVCLQVLFLDHVEHGEADRARYSVAAECAEEFHAVVERARDLGRGDNGAERMAVADWFAEHDDVRYDVVVFEGPEVRADAAVSGLHFIRNANATGRTHHFIHVAQVAWRKNDLPGHTRH